MEPSQSKYHFISKGKTELSLPVRDYTNRLAESRKVFRLTDENRTRKIKAVLAEILRTKRLPSTSEWSFTVQKCGSCGGSVIGGIACYICGMYVCSHCRVTHTIGNGEFGLQNDVLAMAHH